MLIGCIPKFGFGPDRNPLAHGLLQVRIETLFWVEFRAIAGQLEHFDLRCSLSQPGLDGLAVMYAQVVQDQKHLLACVFDQCLQKTRSVGSTVLGSQDAAHVIELAIIPFLGRIAQLVRAQHS